VRVALFGRVLSLESRKLMSYRVDFWLNVVVAFATQLTVAYFLWLAIFSYASSDRIGGFTFRSMVLYYVLVILLGRIIRGLERDLGAAVDIYDGTLTKYLLYPTDYFGFKYAAHLGGMIPGLVQLTLFGLLALLFFDLPGELVVTPLTVMMSIGTVVLANLLMFLMRLAVQLVAFWADNVWSLNTMLRFTADLLGGLMLPLTLFPQWAQDALMWTPFPYLYWVPVMTLLGEVGVAEWARGMVVTAAWAAVMAGVALTIWRRGRLTYTGVGI
jgi:ABC-2 type transport system permease protein